MEWCCTNQLPQDDTETVDCVGAVREERSKGGQEGQGRGERKERRGESG